MGVCNDTSVSYLVESRTQKPECVGSNLGVLTRLQDLAKQVVIE